MNRLLKKLDDLKGWITFIAMIGAGGFTIATTLHNKASAANVEAVATSIGAVEHRVTIIETHHADDDRLLDWLVRATWMQHPELPPPPSRRAP